MKQLIQSFKTGKTEIIEVPVPDVQNDHILIKTTNSLVSLGTEKMLIEFSNSSLLSKARKQPEKVKMVLDKIKTDGLISTINSVRNKLDQPISLGYCNVGKIVKIGQNVDGFKVGDRVISNGPHSEYVLVPKNLVSKIPDNISDEEAAFTVIGSIGLQGIRLMNPTYGETVVVMGLGLIGLLTAELLISNGCNVIGYDIDDKKINIAKSKGIIAFNSTKKNPVNYVKNLTKNVGADGVIITASSHQKGLISDAAKMSRKRGKIILVGVINLNLDRSEFYEKELTFQVSCSYGPGRYDPLYESKSIDYPLPFVRWTENRNFEVILDSISKGRLNVKDLVSEILPFENYEKVYNNISKLDSIAIIFKYKSAQKTQNSIKIVDKKSPKVGKVAIIGAGNFTKLTLLPSISNYKEYIKYIVSSKGLNSTLLAKKYDIEFSSSSFDEVLKDNDIEFIFITTRHNLHSNMILKSLKAKKHVFVEKPLALNLRDLKLIENEYKKTSSSLMLGFNRRFSPHIIKIKSLISSNPINIVATMNAGFIPSDSWVHDKSEGGGRIIGEACHYFDLLVFLTGSKIKSICSNSLESSENEDNVSILLKFHNGSNGVINYFSNGSKSYSKERIEIFSNGKNIILDNFSSTKGYGFKNFSSLKTYQDKGHKNQFKNLFQNIVNKRSIEIIPFDEIINVSRASILSLNSIKNNSWINV